MHHVSHSLDFSWPVMFIVLFRERYCHEAAGLCRAAHVPGSIGAINNLLTVSLLSIPSKKSYNT